MNLIKLTQKYVDTFDIVARINLDDWYSFAASERALWLFEKIKSVHQDQYHNNQRILFTLSLGDEFLNENDTVGQILLCLQQALNKIDISNFFVVILTCWPEQALPAIIELQHLSTDPIALTFDFFDSPCISKKRLCAINPNNDYSYNSRHPIGIGLDQMSQREKKLLLESDVFCIYPWTHMFVSPNGDTYPCCGFTYEDQVKIGNTNQNSMREIWNGDAMRKLRINMLNETATSGCRRCYEHEKSGFFSMRHSANKHHGHHINKINQTSDDGKFEPFEMIYWDVRFNNLCNLRCRSCGPQFSTSWHSDQLKIAPDYQQPALIYAGKYETDLWDQLLEHMDHVEQIYFAGGEPLMMDEHYRILEELERREKYDVRLIYNTNFSLSRLGKRSVFDYWKKFKHVAVGASLDAMGPRAEYIRKGTDWAVIEQNRRQMMEICPNVDFYISATLSVMNVWHLPDFHRNWTEQGLIQARDFNINNLTDPNYYRIDILPSSYKQEIERKYQEHLSWLSPQDDLRRASNGYQSAINFMMGTDNTHLIQQFWQKTHQLDEIRHENWQHYLPELEALQL